LASPTPSGSRQNVYLRDGGPKGIEVVDLVCNRVTVERMSTTPGAFRRGEIKVIVTRNQ
jgi:hypothetical protein